MIRKLLRRNFCVSTDMLVSLSISHLKGQFDSSDALVGYLHSSKLVSDPRVQEFLRTHERTDFTKEKTFGLHPAPLKQGVEVTNPAMQAVMLDTINAVLQSTAGRQDSLFKAVDAGCANGFLTLGTTYLLRSIRRVASSQQDLPFVVYGIDMDRDAILQAMQLQTRFNYDLEKTVFSKMDAFELFEQHKGFDLIVFGMGITRADLLSVLLLNEKEDAVVVAPIFEADTQQGLLVVARTQLLPLICKSC